MIDTDFDPKDPTAPHDDSEAFYTRMRSLATGYFVMHALDKDRELHAAAYGDGDAMPVHELLQQRVADFVECASSFENIARILDRRRREREAA